MPASPAPHRPTISVVIPAYNERDGITHCLERLSRQSDDIVEIIVVDNNSVDGTADIVNEFARADPRIRVHPEHQAGVAYARYSGFRVATGDLIASIDADTLIGDTWAESIATTFAAHPSIGGGGAPMTMHDLPGQKKYARRYEKMFTQAEKALARGSIKALPALSGANSVITRSAWAAIANEVSVRSDLFEDLDRSICLQEKGFTLAVIPGMTATVSGRRLLSGPAPFLRYAACGPRTHRAHGQQRQAAIAWVANMVIFGRTMAHLPVNRAWDPHTQSCSLTRIFSDLNVRDSPIG